MRKKAGVQYLMNSPAKEMELKVMTTREVTHDEARQIAKRFIDANFNNPGERPRIGIPARPNYDDDLLLYAYIEQQASRPLQQPDAMVEADAVRKLIDARIARCRTAISECDNWSPAQAEWSRARDQLLDLKDNFEATVAALSAAPRPVEHDPALVEQLGDVLDIIAAAEHHFANTEAHHNYYADRHRAVQEAVAVLKELPQSAPVVVDEVERLKEALAYTLDDWEALVRIIGTNIKENDCADRVRWKGVWYDGPLATAYLKTLRAIEEMATRNVAALRQSSAEDAG